MSERIDYVVVMDDDYGSLKFYAGILQKARPTQVVGQAESPPALLDWLRQPPTRVDVAIVDAEYRDQSLPLDTLVRETLERADVRVVCLSQYGNPEKAQNAVRAGARGYLLKHEVGPALPRAIHRTSSHELVVTPGIAPALARLAWELRLDLIVQRPWAPSPFLTPRPSTPPARQVA